MKNIEDIIQTSSAYPSRLRELALNRSCDIRSLVLFSREWFQITRFFGLNAPRSLDRIATHILKLPIENEETKIVEQVLQKVSAIAIDDLGQARGKTATEQLLHFRLFEKQCRPLIQHHPEIHFFGEPELASTQAILSGIEKSFTGSVLDILVQFMVVEGTALEIVNAMYPLYMRCRSIYTNESQIEYVTLHQGIEGEHSIESLQMIKDWLSIHPEQEELFYEKLKDKLEEWGNFWTEVTNMLFK